MPELLAPASDLKTAAVAFANGADAVYAGLKKFNARERAVNFSFSDFARLVQYAEDRKKKAYLAFNTLIKEDELEEAVEYLTEIARIRPHALLVQDLGMLQLLRQHFPCLEIHASTQMGTHNTCGVAALAKLGVKRVILERQLSLAEIKQITADSSIETEIFVHGALCCSLSGQCLFSSWMGGMSGNRGKCKQPCRRRYHHSTGNGFFFSPNDLYTLDLIPKLMDSGVSAFKIEGRLKDSDHIGRTVKAYRMIMEGNGESCRERMGEARNVLAGAFGRKWSHGFYTKESRRDLIKYDALGVAGMLAGKIVKTSSGGFTLKCSHPLKPGDKIRVQPPTGEDGPTLSLENIYTLDNRPARKADKGQTVFVESESTIPTNGKVYKIGQVGKESEDNSTDLPPANESMQIIRPDIAVRINQDEIACTVKILDSEMRWRRRCDEIEAARKRELTKDKIREEFSKSLDNTLRPRHISVELPGGIFIPFTVLRDIRRDFWTWTQDKIAQADLRSQSREKVESVCLQLMTNPVATPRNDQDTTISPRTEKTVYAGSKSEGDISLTENIDIRAHDVSRIPGDRQAPDNKEAVLPAFCREENLPGLRQAVQTAYTAGIRRFRVTALFGFHLLKDYPDININCSFPLPVTNSLALQAVLAMGADKAMAWPELDKDSLDKLLHRGKAKLEIYKFGRLPLLVSRAEIPVEGDITDSRGGKFRILRENGLTFVYPELSFYNPYEYSVSSFYDLSHADGEEENFSEFNLKRDWT